MIKEIVLNEKTVLYDLQRKNVKNINLRIKADRTIVVSANQSTSDQVIEDFILSKYATKPLLSITKGKLEDGLTTTIEDPLLKINQPTFFFHTIKNYIT